VNPTALERALELAPDPEGRLVGSIPEGWRVAVGVHGGLVTALLTRAATLAAGPERRLRSITVHFPRPASPGPVVISTELIREGSGTTSLALRMMQAGEVVALAIAAAGRDREALEHDRLPMPEVADVASVESIPFIEGLMPEFQKQVETRHVGGGGPGSPTPDGSAVVESWLRPSEPGQLDAPTVAFLADAAWPSIFAIDGLIVGAPTIDLTVHFRAPLPHMSEDGWVLGRFESRLVRDGHFEEDGILWARDGTVLAQSRQLALVLPLSGRNG